MLHAKTRQVNIRGDAGPARSIKLYAVYAGEPLKPSIDNYYWTGFNLVPREGKSPGNEVGRG